MPALPEPLEVGHLAGSFYHGGIGRVLENMRKFSENHHEVVCFDTKYGDREWVNVVEKRFDMPQYDIYLFHQGIYFLLPLVWKGPKVRYYHGINVDSASERIESLLNRTVQFDRYIAPSEFAAKEIGLDNVSVIYEGVNLDKFHPSPSDLKTPLSLFFVGGFARSKRQDVLIRSLEYMDSAKLKIAGSVQDEKYFKECKTISDDRTEFLKYVTDEKLVELYQACDIYVTASEWEMFGLPLLEAMACGKPVVASECCSHPELIEKSNAGVTFESGNPQDLSRCIRKVMDNYDLYRKNALEFAENHSWEKSVKRVDLCLRDVVCG